LVGSCPEADLCDSRRELFVWRDLGAGAGPLIAGFLLPIVPAHSFRRIGCPIRGYNSRVRRSTLRRVAEYPNTPIET
jgi:hypothetical protein